MKCLKTLGLAAVAIMALTAFLGASSASATVLCKTTSTPCGLAWHWSKGTVIYFSLKPGTKIVKTSTSGEFEDECSESTIKVATTNTGSRTETVDGEVSVANLTWGGCSAEETETIAGGLLEIHWIAGTDNGTVTAKNLKVKVKRAGISCVIEAGAGIDLGTLTSGNPAIMSISTTVNVTGSFLCPPSAILKAEYVVTSPTPLYVESE